MKYLALLLVLPALASACDKGCTEYEGVCACDAPTVGQAPEKDWSSNEKPPRSHLPVEVRDNEKQVSAIPAQDSPNTAHDYAAERAQR